MTSDELQRLARLIDQRTREVRDALAPEPSSVDLAICDLLGYECEEDLPIAMKFAQLACAYRGLTGESSRAIEVEARRRSIKRPGLRLPQHVRESLLAVCALPLKNAPPPRDDRSATERLEDAVANERRKPYAEQRHALVRKWLEELEALRDTQDDIYATA